jgi:hydrogenase maturation protease
MGKIVVLGIGNILSRDEGVGVHAVRALEAQYEPPAGNQHFAAVDFVDGGTLGLNLLSLVEEASHLLVLDAVDAHRPPGTVITLAQSEVPRFTGIKLSQHQVTFQELLGLASVRDKFPPNLVLIGIQPADIATGLELSTTVAAALPEVLRRATDVLQSWNITT